MDTKNPLEGGNLDAPDNKPDNTGDGALKGDELDVSSLTEKYITGPAKEAEKAELAQQAENAEQERLRTGGRDFIRHDVRNDMKWLPMGFGLTWLGTWIIKRFEQPSLKAFEANAEKALKEEKEHLATTMTELKAKSAQLDEYQSTADRLRADLRNSTGMSEDKRIQIESLLQHLTRLIVPLDATVREYTNASEMSSSLVSAHSANARYYKQKTVESQAKLLVLHQFGSPFLKLGDPAFESAMGRLVERPTENVLAKPKKEAGPSTPDSKVESKKKPKKPAEIQAEEEKLDDTPAEPEDISVWPDAKNNRYIFSVGEMEHGKVVSFDRIEKIKKLGHTDNAWNAKEALKDEIFGELAESYYEGEDLASLEDHVDDALNDMLSWN